MATAVGDLVINLLARNKASAPINAAGKSLQALGGVATRVMGTLGATLTFAGITAALSKSVRLAEEQRKAEMKLGAVLKATGGAAGYTTSELKAYAAELQGLTNYGDEATINAMAMLATFKEVKGGVFKNATAVIQDMATVLDTDLKSATIQVGKALNDPIKGVTALTRAGVSFTQQQKDQIAALQESGDLLGAQQIILGELQSEFGGAAAAMADPWTQMKNAAGDFMEVIGGELVPYIRLAASGLKDWLTSAQGDLASTGDQVSTLGQIFGTIVDVVALIGVGWKFLQASVTKTIQVMAEGVANLLEMLDKVGTNALRMAATAAIPVGGLLIPEDGTSQAASFARTFAEELERTGTQQWEDAMDALSAKTPSEKAALLAAQMAKAAENTKVAAGAMGDFDENVSDSVKNMSEQFDKKIETMRLQLAGLTENQIAAMQTPDATLVEQMDLLQQADKLDELEKQKKVHEDIDAIIEKTRTSTEKYEAELARLAQLKAAGGFDIMGGDELYQRAQEDAKQLLGDTNAERALRGSAATKGSAEAYSRIYAAMDGGKGNPAKATAENTKAMKSDLARMREGIDEMRRGRVKLVGIEEAAA